MWHQTIITNVKTYRNLTPFQYILYTYVHILGMSRIKSMLPAFGALNEREDEDEEDEKEAQEEEKEVESS